MDSMTTETSCRPTSAKGLICKVPSDISRDGRLGSSCHPRTDVTPEVEAQPIRTFGRFMAITLALWAALATLSYLFSGPEVSNPFLDMRGL